MFSVHIIKHGGFGLWQTSHHSHNENYSHLNIVIKENFKGPNETKLIKTSCNDERGCRWDMMQLTHTHKHAGTRLHSEFVFHILSTGCVMTPVIKVGNCSGAALLDPGAVLQTQLEASGCKVAEQWNREQGWADTERMVSASKGDASIVLSDPCEWHSAHLLPYPPWDSHWLCPLASWNQTLHVITAVSLAEVRDRSHPHKGI